MKPNAIRRTIRPSHGVGDGNINDASLLVLPPMNNQGDALSRSLKNCGNTESPIGRISWNKSLMNSSSSVGLSSIARSRPTRELLQHHPYGFTVTFGSSIGVISIMESLWHASSNIILNLWRGDLLHIWHELFHPFIKVFLSQVYEPISQILQCMLSCLGSPRWYNALEAKLQY